jgi:outer membrane protein OmpA-like peptidoglycan-associated protein
MTKSLPSRLALVCTLAALGGAARAQTAVPLDRHFSPQLFHPPVGPDQFFSLEPARPLEHLNFSLGLWLNYSRGGYSVLQVSTPDANGKRTIGSSLAQLQKDAFAADAVFAIGLFDRLQLGLGVPLTLYQTGDTQIVFPDGNPYPVPALSAFAMGDPWIDAKVRLVGTERGGPQLALSGILTLPLSRVTPDAFGGDDNLDVAINALGGWEASRWRAGIKVGFLYRADKSQLFSTTIGHQILYGGALAFDAVKDRKVSLIAELQGHTDVSGSRITNVDATAIEADLGAKFKLARAVFATVGVGTGVFRGYGAPLVRVLAGITWAPDRRDRDHDGIPDIEDRCPDQPEDKDGYKDDDGCPDPDNDGDGIPDARDKCPNDAEDFDGFQDDDGCPELDNDGDGIPDIKDACPNDKEDGKPPKPADGCPANKVDSDEDGIPDAQDKCPLDPEDKDGFEDADGCPDVDNDNDGIPDQFDKCPNEAEDVDGFEDDDGCPEPDNDHDGIPDKQDKCPNEPETVNGVADDDGCPDRGPPLKVQILGDEIVIMEKVFFKTAKAIIEVRSHNLLDQVASVLKMHSEIGLVLIEGHTDGQGALAKNMKLSQDRADAVKLYLLQHGVAPGRLTARGFGPTMPVADNTTERGREANRRVQFRILETTRKPPPPAGGN